MFYLKNAFSYLNTHNDYFFFFFCGNYTTLHNDILKTFFVNKQINCPLK